MGLEHFDAVLERSGQSGSSLTVLLVIARHSGPHGEWIADQPTLQKQARLSRRGIQLVLAQLVAAGELAVESHHGRGKRSTYRLLVGEPAREKAQPGAPFPAPKGEAPCAFAAPDKREPECAFPLPKGEPECAFPHPKGEAPSAFSSPLAPPCPPFPPHPQFPPNPPHSPEKTEKEKQETFGLRPLTGPRSAVFRVNLLLEEAGVPLPTPAQIGLWSKTLGGIEPLLDLLGRLVQAGLANKREPIVYAHRVVMEQAARPTSPARPAPGTVLDARAGRELLWSAGADEIRWQQAQEIIENTEES